MGDDVRAGGHVRRDEDVGPVVGPSGVVLVVVGRRRYLLQPLRVFSLLPHCFRDRDASKLQQRLYFSVLFVLELN